MHQQRDVDATGPSTDVLFERHAPALFTYLRRHTCSREDAEDILLDIFTAVMEDTRFANLAETAQTAWLWRVARNKTVDAFRKAGKRQHVSLEHIADTVYAHEQDNPEQAALHIDTIVQLKQLLADLPPQQQEILLLRFGYEMRSPEIATITGKSESAVRSILSRTMNFLRRSHKIQGREE